MKIGFIVECGPNGAETVVIPYLARQLAPEIETDVVPLEKKPLLKKQCGAWAAQLLASGCDKVLIVWDLLPDWGEFEGSGCLHVDRQEIFQSLNNAGIEESDERVHLVCIHKMLEAWLIADERAIARFLSTAARQVDVPRKKKTESIRDPKSAMNEIFRKSHSRYNRYEDRLHAIEIVKHMQDLSRLGRLDTFRRFQAKLLS
ncbi:MAG: hypothetical protein A2511_13550 [Deltaproteobacteria bacterium RIFOXYD12_FULL_50_9]|nr:MAG: hypothetical protein A2511_13550 [Deltaproteobacteria bacterium RIFOXYD12_FULL_50_9]